MRFNTNIAKNCVDLFRHKGDEEYEFKYLVEELHLDNTFCDPIFKFPKRVIHYENVVLSIEIISRISRLKKAKQTIFMYR